MKLKRKQRDKTVWYTAQELVALTKVTYRQLNYWVEIGLVPCIWVSQRSLDPKQAPPVGPLRAGSVRLFDESALQALINAGEPCEECGCDKPSHKILGRFKDR